MDINRIKEIQEKTAYPDSISVQQALLQVWNECQKDAEEDMFAAFCAGIECESGNHPGFDQWIKKYKKK